MKVLMIAPQPFFAPRGTPISVYQRLWGLSKLGHKVDLLTYHLGENVGIPGMNIHRIPSVSFIKSIKPGPSWRKLLLDSLLFIKAIIMLLRKRYDVIHTHEESAFFSIPLALLFRKRHVYDRHSNLSQQLISLNFGNSFGLYKLFDLLEKRVVKTCDAVITIGSDLAQRVREINPQTKHIVIENLAVQATFPPKSRDSVHELRQRFCRNGNLLVVYAGNFERYQGIDLLVESAEIVVKNHPETLFLLVGANRQQIEHWSRVISGRKLSDSVHFLRAVPVEDMCSYLDIASILVSPRTEGMSIPLKLYTYLHAGKPIVATRLSAHTQVLNSRSAVLVPPTKESFAEGIMKLIRDPELREHLGCQAGRLAEQMCNPQDYLAKLDLIYQNFGPSSQTSDQPQLTYGNR